MLSALVLAPAASAQDPAAPAQPTPPPATPAKSTEPDYPDPRTITIGVFYWLAIPGTGPNLVGGHTATTYENLPNFGKEKFAPGFEVSVPITRTGEIKAEGFLAKGDGTEKVPLSTGVFSVGFNTGDQLNTQYQIKAGKVYLDDLLYPFKFPVSKFRLKSLWEFQYIGIKGTVDAPTKPQTDAYGNAVTTSGNGSRNILFPTFGMAAEYAISPHVLLRGSGSGFGLLHRADIWDAEGTVSYRRKSLEIRGGYKALHFKTSPQKDQFFVDTLSGGFVGLRYHWQ